MKRTIPRGKKSLMAPSCPCTDSQSAPRICLIFTVRGASQIIKAFSENSVQDKPRHIYRGFYVRFRLGLIVCRVKFELLPEKNH